MALRLVIAAAALMSCCLAPWATARAATCRSATDVQQAREAIEAACGCPIGGRSAFLKCTRRALAAATQTTPCKRAALRAVRSSLCGRAAGAVVCCSARGRRRGRIARSAKACRSGEACADASRTPLAGREPLFLSSVDDRCSAQSSCLTTRVGHRVAPDIAPSVAALPGLDGGAPRSVAVAVAPDGRVEEFVEDEVVIYAAGAGDLEAFLAAYGGVVLRDGTMPTLAGEPPAPGATPPSGWYLIRIDPSRSSLEDLDANMTAAGAAGRWAFSSEKGARLAALAAREAARAVSLNFLVGLDQARIPEHPDNTGGHLDAATWWWLTEDDDPVTPGDQGLSVGVVHAWDYVKYAGYPPANAPYAPVRLAVIDSGFDLDTVTGVPTGGNGDYPPQPLQLDLVDGDATAGGHGVGFSNCNDPSCWHGQLSFGACCARAGNGFGSAGTSGGWEIVPLVLKVSGDIYQVSTAINAAIHHGADVINASLAFDCGWWCRNYQGGNMLQTAVLRARSQGVIVVASAGNEARDLGGVDLYPCVLDGVICVGAIGHTGAAEDYSSYGTPVDLWAPACFLTTVTRPSAGADANDVGHDELGTFCGTSASSPFLAGVVALMKMLDRGLSSDQARGILQTTANPSPHPKVAATGYVDAYRAVTAVRPNRPPEVTITAPVAGATLGYEDVDLVATVHDPESPSPAWWSADFSSTLVFSSSRDGELCSVRADATGAERSLRCLAARLSVGTHTITATATDPFGATGSASTTVSVANRAPTALLDYPQDGASFYTSQKINLRGTAFDPDETIPDASLEWWTMLQGQPLQLWVFQGTGRSVWVSLPAGTYSVALVVKDTFGASATATITLTVQTGAGYPTAEIFAPTDKEFVRLGVPITLWGNGTDPEEGDLPNSALQWSSDRDGPLGTGRLVHAMLSGSPCNTVLHVITLRATDSDGHQGTHAVTVAVVDLC